MAPLGSRASTSWPFSTERKPSLSEVKGSTTTYRSSSSSGYWARGGREGRGGRGEGREEGGREGGRGGGREGGREGEREEGGRVWRVCTGRGK